MIPLHCDCLLMKWTFPIWGITLDDRSRGYPGLQLFPDLTFIFHGQLRRKLAVSSRLGAGINAIQSEVKLAAKTDV